MSALIIVFAAGWSCQVETKQYFALRQATLLLFTKGSKVYQYAITLGRGNQELEFTVSLVSAANERMAAFVKSATKFIVSMGLACGIDGNAGPLCGSG